MVLRHQGDGSQLGCISRTMLNLTIADLHTYYVMAGKTPILVHNSNCNTVRGSARC